MSQLIDRILDRLVLISVTLFVLMATYGVIHWLVTSGPQTWSRNTWLTLGIASFVLMQALHPCTRTRRTSQGAQAYAYHQAQERRS